MPRRGDDGRALATVLFTDIVGSTELAAELGGVWVSAAAGQFVERIDPSSNKVVQRLPVDGSPAGLVAAGDVVWVAVHR